MKIQKRDGRIVNYDGSKIVMAVSKAMKEVVGKVDKDVCYQVEGEVKKTLEAGNYPLTVEGIQDSVVNTLMSLGTCHDVAQAYIIYRHERTKERGMPDKYEFLDNEFLKPYKAKKNPFPEEIGMMVYKRTYARPIPEEHRREDWWETVARVVEFSADLERKAFLRQGKTITPEKMEELKHHAKVMYKHMFNLGLFPSGRSLWIGGTQAAYEYSLSNFNCSFVTIDSFRKFDEMFFVLMLGTGVGLSVERKYIEKLPKIRTDVRVVHKDFTPVPRNERLEYTELVQATDTVLQINVGDSKFGWSEAMRIYLEILTTKQYNDIELILINYDNVRPKGEPLKTFGGYASGHGNLKTMFKKIDELLERKSPKWASIKPIDALDIATIIAENVVSGGVRRSALIVFADEDEQAVIEAKSELYRQTESGEWIENLEILHRALSNNTIKYYEKPSYEQLEKHVETMRFNGEPGFLNMAVVYSRREDAEGGNPCMEIFLRDRGVCNLTEINMANYVDDEGVVDFEGLFEAQAMSALIGYRMATIELEIHEWDMVNKEDRLIGCSLTGITDFMQKAGYDYEDMRAVFTDLREIAHTVSNNLADELGMNRPKLATTIKPSGTVSQLPTVASGLHFNHSKYYIRRVRVNAEDPIAIAMAEMGFEWEPEVGETMDNHKTKVFSFPVAAPGTVFKADVSAVEQLEWYKLIMDAYVDHNASITVHVKDDEWKDVTDWLDKNWDYVAGVSFLPYDGGVYKLAPYEEIDEETYNEMLARTPKFDTNILSRHEKFGEEFDILDSDCDTGACPVR